MQLTKTSDSMISWYGPGLALVSARSHFCGNQHCICRALQRRTYKNVLQACLDTQVNSTTTTSTQGAYHQDTWKMAGFRPTLLDSLLDVFDQRIFVLVRGDARQQLVFAMRELPCPRHEGERCTGEARMVAESCHSAPLLVFKELEIE